MILTIPTDIQFPIPWTFVMCVTHVVDTCPQFNTNRPGIRSGDRIANAVLGKVAGDVIELADEDILRLDEAFNEPTAGYCPPIAQTQTNESGAVVQIPVSVPARVFLPYIEAVSR